MLELSDATLTAIIVGAVSGSGGALLMLLGSMPLERSRTVRALNEQLMAEEDAVIRSFHDPMVDAGIAVNTQALLFLKTQDQRKAEKPQSND